MTDWRPIESAPRDGTPVLVWPAAGSEAPMAVAQYYGSAWIDCADWVYYDDPAPSHWQPLPSPPEET